MRALKQAVYGSEGVEPRLITVWVSEDCVVQAVTTVARAEGPGYGGPVGGQVAAGALKSGGGLIPHQGPPAGPGAAGELDYNGEGGGKLTSGDRL